MHGQGFHDESQQSGRVSAGAQGKADSEHKLEQITGKARGWSYDSGCGQAGVEENPKKK